MRARLKLEHWYFAKEGDTRGPFSLENVEYWSKQGEVTGKTKVWKTGMDEWVEAETVEELFPFGIEARSEAPPPLDDESVWKADLITADSDLERRFKLSLAGKTYEVTYRMAPTMARERVELDGKIVWQDTCRRWQTERIEFDIDDRGTPRRCVVEKHFDKKTFHKIDRFRFTVDGRELYREGSF